MFQSIKNLIGKDRYKLESIRESGKFVCGQVWKYKTRHQEPHSRLTITQIDKDIKGTEIFHVLLDQLEITNPHHPEGKIKELGHTPLTRDALEDSVNNLDKTLGKIPVDKAGYNEWYSNWAQGNAGIFSMPVKEIIDYVEQSLNLGEENEQALKSNK